MYVRISYILLRLLGSYLCCRYRRLACVETLGIVRGVIIAIMVFLVYNALMWWVVMGLVLIIRMCPFVNCKKIGHIF